MVRPQRSYVSFTFLAVRKLTAVHNAEYVGQVVKLYTKLTKRNSNKSKVLVPIFGQFRFQNDPKVMMYQ